MFNNEKRGKFLKQLRKEKNITQEEVANKIHYSSKVLSNWENGKNFPTNMEQLNILADFYNVTLQELLNGERKNENTITEEEKLLARKYSKLYSKRKIKFYIVITILLLFIILLLLTYFIFIKNSIKMYSINYSDEDIDINNSYILITNKEDRLILSNIKQKNKKTITHYEIYNLNNDNKDIIYTGINKDNTIIEPKGYEEYNLINMINNDTYMAIYFSDKTTKDIKLEIDKVYSNDKIWYKKTQEIAAPPVPVEELSCNDYFKENFDFVYPDYQKELKYGTVSYLPDFSVDIISFKNENEYFTFNYHFNVDTLYFLYSNFSTDYKEESTISLEDYPNEKDCLKEECIEKEDWLSYINFLRNKCK